MLVHWATGLRSGLLPEDCGVATSEMRPKNIQRLEVCLMVLMCGARELFLKWLWQVLAGMAEVFC